MHSLSRVLPLLLALGAWPASATAPEPKLEVSPAAVKLPDRGKAQVLVVLANPGPDELLDLRLSTRSDAALKVDTPDGTIERLPAGAMQPWTLTVEQESGPAPSLTGTVLLRVDYAWREKSGAPSVPRVVLGSFTVAEREPPATEKPVAVEIKGTTGSLDEHRPGILYVVVSNTSKGSVEVTRLAPRPDSASDKRSLHVAIRSDCRPAMLAPRSTWSCVVDVEPTDAVRSGKHLVLLDLGLRWRQDGRDFEAVEALSHEVEVGVFGESALLTALGVPSFLLLPGFLLVSAFALLGALFSVAPLAESKRYGSLAKASEPGFWVLAVSLSMLAALLYPVVTRLFGWPRNYLQGYGLKDVVAVWMASVFLAALLFLLREVWLRRQTFAPRDDVVSVLCKLGRRGSRLYREQYDVAPADGAGPERLLVLEDRTGAEAKLWLAPKALLRWTTDEESPLRSRIEALLTEDTSPAELARLLKRAAGKILTVEWSGTATVRGPRLVEAAKLGEKKGKAPLVAAL